MERSARTRHLRQLVNHPARATALRALAAQAATLAPSMTARGVSTCFWSFSVLQREDAELFDALGARAKALCKQLDVQVGVCVLSLRCCTLFSQAVCTIAWACGYARYHDHALFMMLAAQALHLLQRYAVALSHAIDVHDAWHATVHNLPPYVHCQPPQRCRQPHAFRETELVMLLSGFAKTFVTDPAPASTLLRSLAARVADAAPTMQPQVGVDPSV